ncbi:PREDICTED: uncharacterized protein LOC101805633 [Ficedula albicollis]|uniref:uncharacterized protein LOC101805633 n=1 Tax=Ficedula albicollis TaxID=59894 RepID=UPI00035A2E18|nr:PREDICTED: uncharacterized protein LOC101805633 [Ficedula albicollis]
MIPRSLRAGKADPGWRWNSWNSPAELGSPSPPPWIPELWKSRDPIPSFSQALGKLRQPRENFPSFPWKSLRIPAGMGSCGSPGRNPGWPRIPARESRGARLGNPRTNPWMESEQEEKQPKLNCAEISRNPVKYFQFRPFLEKRQIRALPSIPDCHSPLPRAEAEEFGTIPDIPLWRSVPQFPSPHSRGLGFSCRPGIGSGRMEMPRSWDTDPPPSLRAAIPGETPPCSRERTWGDAPAPVPWGFSSPASLGNVPAAVPPVPLPPGIFQPRFLLSHFSRKNSSPDSPCPGSTGNIPAPIHPVHDLISRGMLQPRFFQEILRPRIPKGCSWPGFPLSRFSREFLLSRLSRRFSSPVFPGGLSIPTSLLPCPSPGPGRALEGRERPRGE